jgi:hypothetical protein
MSAGQLTCAELVDIQVKAAEMWKDNATNKDYIANVDTINAIKAEQTARIEVLESSEKDRDVKVAWVNSCETATTACSDDCTVGGSELETGCETYALSVCRNAPGFTVREKVMRTSMFSKEELIAKGMMSNMKALDNYINDYAISVIYANKGANAFTGSKGTVNGFTTSISPAYWNASLFSYLYLAAKKNKFSDPFLLSGDNLFEAEWNAKMSSGNADGKGDLAKFNSMRKYFDVLALDSELDPDKISFIIDRGALAFQSKAYNPSVPIEYNGAGLTRYKVASKNIAGVEYDVTYTTRCVSDEIYHDFSLKAKFDVLINPKGCNPNNTGILAFKCA